MSDVFSDSTRHPLSTAQSKTRPASRSRLLWRGSLLCDGTKLHGLAFVALLHHEQAALPFEQPQSSGSRPNFFRTVSNSSVEDPFSPASACMNSAQTDLFLDLEMLRHRDLTVQRFVDLAIAPTESASKGHRGQKSRFELLKKGKERIQIDEATSQDVDIRVFVDPRCSRTQEWLESRFCMDHVDSEGKTGRGLLISLGDTFGWQAFSASELNLLLLQTLNCRWISSSMAAYQPTMAYNYG